MAEEGLLFGDSICPSNTMDLIEHFGCYAALAKFVKGQRVLDTACGEGYGSWLLKEWGASSVLGLDASEEAISAARREFSRDGVDFRVANAGDVVSALPSASFDLIACFGTIERADDPERFLTGLRSLAAPGARIFISCANAHVACLPDQQHPYHLRKHTFEEFKELSERVLGSAGQWLLGVNVQGHALMDAADPLISEAELTSKPIFAMDGEGSGAFLLPSQQSIRSDRSDVLYYVGVWGVLEPVTPVSVLAPPRRISVGLSEAHDCFAVEKRKLQEELESASARLVEAKRQILGQGALITRLGGDVRVRGLEEAVRLKDDLQASYEMLVQAKEELRVSYDMLAQSKEELQVMYDTVLHSKSWRLTRPLRILTRLMRGDIASVRQSLAIWRRGR